MLRLEVDGEREVNDNNEDGLKPVLREKLKRGTLGPHFSQLGGRLAKKPHLVKVGLTFNDSRPHGGF
jgi:hypothetical protein